MPMQIGTIQAVFRARPSFLHETSIAVDTPGWQGAAKAQTAGRSLWSNALEPGSIGREGDRLSPSRALTARTDRERRDLRVRAAEG